MDAPDRQRVGVALFLSVALAVAAGLADFGAPDFQHETEITLHTFEEAVDGEEGAARTVTHGDVFTITRSEAVSVELTRDQPTGWAGVLVGLVPQGATDADVRDVPLELFDGDPVASAHLSQVLPGQYRLRIEGATDAASAPAHARVSVTGGRRTVWPLLVAALLVWAPALRSLTRRPARSAEPGAPPPATRADAPAAVPSTGDS